ncbi:MAG: T9SS type A sorting domain-containing protein [Bacteroidia bacterium]|nr:T9SS type A sorting domain-containing protein [Bacteroidia bacterium]
MKKNYLGKSIMMVALLFFCSVTGFGQNDTMLRVKFMSEVLPNLPDGSYSIVIELVEGDAVTTTVNHPGYFVYTNTDYPTPGEPYVADVYLFPEEGYELILDEEQLSTLIEEIDSETEKSAVLLYPNPTSDEVTLQWKKGFQSSDVKVYDINGKLIAQRVWKKESSLTLNTSAWAEGTYFIQIETGEQERMYMKLVINK